MATEHKYVLGKVDYYGKGRANCEAEITWKLENGNFSMCAGIWQPNKRDYEICGQCVDTVASFFPNDAKAQRMKEIWGRWHLNDMRAGSPAQMAWLEANPLDPKDYNYPKSHYTAAVDALKAAGLHPDNNYIHNGKPYAYGTAWLKETLPPDVIAEIESWSEGAKR